MDKLKELLVRAVEAMREILDAAGEDNLTTEQQTKYDELMTERDSLTERVARAEDLAKAEADLAKSAGRAAPPEPPKEPEQRVVIPRAHGRLRGFREIPGQLPAAERAHRFGIHILDMMGIPWGTERARSMGIPTVRTQLEGTNTTGGFLVANEFSPDIIELVEEYGAFRANANVEYMASETKTVPRFTDGVTAYFVGEEAAVTETATTWDQVGLTARKLMAMTKISNELNEDAVISVADWVIRSMARQFAYKEDLCGFLGDGSATYGSINGVINRLFVMNGTDDGGGAVVASENVLASITLKDWGACIGRLPGYADANAKWYTNKWVWGGSMMALDLAGGGNTAANIQAGAFNKMFLGFPVVIVTGSIFPTTDTNSQTLALFGDLEQAATFGDRRAFTVSIEKTGDDAIYDRISIIASERFDINVHDIGDVTNAGPIIQLIAKAS